MHWHAIRRSTRPRRQESIASGDDAREIPHPCALGNLPRDKASGHGSPHEKSKTIPTATDATRVDTPMGSSQEAPVQPIGEVQAILSLFQLVSDPTQDPTDNNKDETPRSSFNNSDEELSTADDTGDHSFIQVDIPKTPSGISTFEHERAMRNRIPRDKLDRNAIYDKHKYTPTFLHDCLVLPGSLANLIGKQNPVKLVRRMTPALLSGFQTYAHPETQQPCLLQSSRHEDYAQGMVLFGQGREARDCIHEHYRSYTRKVKVQVEVELLTPGLDEQTSTLLRKKIWANAWVWSGVGGLAASVGAGSTWTLGTYLSGSLGRAEGMRIGRAPFIGEDHPDEDDKNQEDDSPVWDQLGEVKTMNDKIGPSNGRNKPLAHFGSLGYERSTSAIGK